MNQVVEKHHRIQHENAVQWARNKGIRLAYFVLYLFSRSTKTDAIVVSAAFAGSLGTAWIIQRAILAICLKAITTTRRN